MSFPAVFVAAELELWFDWELDLWPLVMACLVGFTCGLLGTVFLVRRTALLGDAVSHSVLPGVAGGLLVAGMVLDHSDDAVFGASPTMLFILAGALAAGLLSTALIEAFFRYSRIKPDTALGAVFPAFFAAGVILIRSKASGAHFDVDCVFYGRLENIRNAGQVVPTLISALLVIVFFTIAYKEILITSFDRSLSTSLGLRVRLVNRILVGLLAMAVVSAFEAVGAILVISLLIVPPATATLLTQRFHRVLGLSAFFGVTAAVLGSWLTIVLVNVGLETSRAPSVAIVAGAQFLVAFLFGPRHGLVSSWRRGRGLRLRILEENLLGAVYRIAQPEAATRKVGLEQAAAALDYPTSQLRGAARRCAKRGELALSEDGRVSLTTTGERRIREVIRAHRLWERYMITEMDAAADHVHDAADRIEHHLQPSLVRDLELLLGSPREDPHGREIPGEV